MKKLVLGTFAATLLAGAASSAMAEDKVPSTR